MAKKKSSETPENGNDQNESEKGAEENLSIQITNPIDIFRGFENVNLPIIDPIAFEGLSVPGIELFGNYNTFYDDIGTLRSELREKAEEIKSKNIESKEKDKKIQEYKRLSEELTKKAQLSSLLSRVNAIAQNKLLESEDFRNEFNDESLRYAFVMSVDIRRSTEMMLKSKEPKLYAKFITELSEALKNIVLRNMGIYYQFTGDGLLSFFPSFYSGEDAGYYTIKSASECHFAFDEIYKNNRKSFTSIMADVGLGIGIDYGLIQTVEIAGDMSIVGTPVVYACRMSGAGANTTLLNQSAYEQIFENYSSNVNINETEIDVKHEGKTLAYRVNLNEKSKECRPPAWMGD